jgi:hypothetical protein
MHLAKTAKNYTSLGSSLTSRERFRARISGLRSMKQETSKINVDSIQSPTFVMTTPRSTLVQHFFGQKLM